MIISLIDYSKYKVYEANFKFWDELDFMHLRLSKELWQIASVPSTFVKYFNLL